MALSTSLHRGVTAFFVSRGCGSDSELLDDVTIDRVAKKIYKGEDVRSIVAYQESSPIWFGRDTVRDRDRFRKAVRDFNYLNAGVQEFEENH